MPSKYVPTGRPPGRPRKNAAPVDAPPKKAADKETVERAAKGAAGAAAFAAVAPPPILVKRPIGRPALYKPEYCEQVVELGAKGKSLAQIAAALDVSRANLYDWAERYPEFSSAVSRAKDLALAWWEDAGANLLAEIPKGPKLNTILWSKIMSARFPDDYRDQWRAELTGKNGGPVAVSSVTDAELIALIGTALAKKPPEDSEKKPPEA